MYVYDCPPQCFQNWGKRELTLLGYICPKSKTRSNTVRPQEPHQSTKYLFTSKQQQKANFCNCSDFNAKVVHEKDEIFEPFEL